MCEHHLYASVLVLMEVRRGAKSPGTGMASVCESPGRCWELNVSWCPRQEQPVLFVPEPPSLTNTPAKVSSSLFSMNSLLQPTSSLHPGELILPLFPSQDLELNSNRKTKMVCKHMASTEISYLFFQTPVAQTHDPRQ